MKCLNCGYENMNDNNFCEKCGQNLKQMNVNRNEGMNNSFNAQSYGYYDANGDANYTVNAGTSNNSYCNQQYPAMNNANNNRQYNVNVVSPEIQNSYFDGNMWQLLGWNLLCGLITFITLGFGGPWARVLKIRWQTKHTVINGKRLYFNGTAPQLFGKLILWWLLLGGIMLILTIAGIVTGVKTGGYYYYSTYFDASNLILAIVIDVIIVLFASPAFYIFIKKWETKHTTFIDDNGMVFNHMSNGQIYYAPTPQYYSGYSNQNIYYQNQNVQSGYSNEAVVQNNMGNSDQSNNCQQNNNQ